MNVLYLQFPIVPEEDHYRKSSVWLLLPAIPTGAGYLLPSYLSENYADGAAFGTVFFYQIAKCDVFENVYPNIGAHITDGNT